MSEEHCAEFSSKLRKNPEKVGLTKTSSSSRLSMSSRQLSLEFGCNSKSSFDSKRADSVVCPNLTNIILSNQGFVTSRPNSSLEKRQIRDKSYYKGLLYRKGFEISSVTKRLMKEIDFMKSDQSAYFLYKKAAENKALELRRLQAALADYNLVIDAINSDYNITRIEEKCQELKMDNEKLLQDAEALFEKRKEKEEMVSKLEEEMNQDEYISEILMASGDSHNRYEYLLRLDKKLASTLRNFDTELIQLALEREELEKECDFLGRKEAKQLCYALKERETKRNNFEECNIENKDFQQLNQMREEIGELLQCILKETIDIKSQITQKEAELIDNEEFDGKRKERQEKVEKLKNREKEMDEFLLFFNQNREILLDECYKNKKKIQNFLEKISEMINLDQKRVLPVNKTEEQLLLYLAKLDQLEVQTKDELNDLRQEMASLKEQLKSVPVTEEMKCCTESIKCELLKEREIVLVHLNGIQKVVRELKKLYDTLSKELNGNKTFQELSQLEKKWQDLEKQNYAMLEYTSDNKNHNSHLNVKNSVMGLARDLNNTIIT